MAKEKSPTFTSGVVTLVYPKLNEPDVYTPKRGKPGKPKYKTDWSEPNVEAEDKLKAYLLKMAKKLCPEADVESDDFGTPWKINKEGDTVFTTSTGMTTKAGKLVRPPVFDAKNQSIPVTQSIGGGTKARLNMSIGVYPDEDGITLYLTQVQVLELVESSYGKSAFDEAEGFSYKGADDNEGMGESTDLDETEDKSSDDEDADVAF
jgi:hypothetical protein